MTLIKKIKHSNTIRGYNPRGSNLMFALSDRSAFKFSDLNKENIYRFNY